MKANDEGLVKIIKTLEPGPYGLLSVTITDARAGCTRAMIASTFFFTGIRILGMLGSYRVPCGS